jgi:hypothetical protein
MAAMNNPPRLIDAAGVVVELRRGGSGTPLLVIHGELGVPGWLESLAQLADHLKPSGFDGTPFIGKVTRFSLRLDPETCNMRTGIDLSNREERLYPGMYAEVSLEMNRRPDALPVPAAAIRVRVPTSNSTLLMFPWPALSIQSEEVRFARDSLLEGTGFELPVRGRGQLIPGRRRPYIENVAER